jgi:cell division protein FtsL
MSPIEVHFNRHINNEGVVREPDARHRREYFLVTLLAGVFGLTLLFYGWQHYRMIQYGYRIEEAHKRREQLAEMRERLRLERSSLRDRRRIDATARRDLGMVAPAAGQWVTLSADAPFTIPVPPESTQPALSAKK